MIGEYIKEIKRIFVENEDRYKAHEICNPILLKLSATPDFLFQVIKKNLSDPEFLKRKRHYSTLAMNIFESPEFSLVMNIFPPLPDRNTDISFQSIHHHGALILSTVSAFGPGYQSIVFKRRFKIDHSTEVASMEIEKDYQNQKGKVEFIDAHQPHVVFYPKEFSATYALWCNVKRTKKEMVKKIGVINSIKKPLAKVINKLGLGRVLGLNKVEYFDFYVENKAIMALKHREAYDLAGDNENFLQNIFSFIQKTAFNDVAFLNELLHNDKIPEAAKKWIEMLLRNDLIEDCFFEGHLNVPRVNLEKAQILQALK